MKRDIFYIIIIFLFVVAGVKSQDRDPNTTRYFLVGYIAEPDNGPGIFNGGEDTVMNHYPNCNELVNWLRHKYAIHNIRIMSVCEQMKLDHDKFWKNVSK